MALLKYKFDSIEMEQRFRTAHFSKKRQQTLYIFIFAIILVAGHFILDLNVLKNSTSLFFSLSARIIAISAIIAGIIFLYRSKYYSFDTVLLAVTTVIVIHMLIATGVRPPDYIALTAWDIFAIYAIYTAIPLKLSYQIIPSMLLATGSIIIWLFVRSPEWNSHEQISLFSAYYAVNIIGIYLSVRLKKYSRKQFELLELERAARDSLEKSQREVKVLRGILPICSFCKKIRNDEGYYEMVDAYITKHSEVDFSHTVCPDCMKEHYPEIDG